MADSYMGVVTLPGSPPALGLPRLRDKHGESPCVDLEARAPASDALEAIFIATEVNRLLADVRFSSEKRLLRSGWRAFSKTDEDGILNEIFQRIRPTSRRFIEISNGDGLDNNTAYLLACGWSGTWLHGKVEPRLFRNCAVPLREKRLSIVPASVTAENANRVLEEALRTPGEIDVLSIDIGGNDYHVLAALDAIIPRVIVVPYNALYRPPVRWIMEYDPNHVADGTTYFGASLSAYEHLLRPRGYSVVGCNLTGVCAFFVRDDELSDYFEQPATAQTHYEPPREYLATSFALMSGNEPRIGPAKVEVPYVPPLPNSEMIYRVSGHRGPKNFEQTGIVAVEDIETGLSRLGRTIDDVKSVFDFGCGCGRIARLLTTRLRDVKFVGSDIDKPAIAWLNKTFPPWKFFVNGNLPPLPFEDASFDFVYGWSVFTHLDEEYQDAWLAELHRVTAPGGSVLLTVSGDAMWSWVAKRSDHPRRSELLELRERWEREGFLFWADDGWEEFFPAFYHTSFHTPEYVRHRWARWFEVVDVIPGGARPSQDMVVMRRRSD